MNSSKTKPKDDEPINKTVISFNSEMIEAIKKKIKTEFRITDNLNIVNLNPDQWKFEGWSDKGAIMINTSSNKNIIIDFPYELGPILKISNLSKAIVEDLYIKISYAAVRRIQNFNMEDALKEGMRIYENEIENYFQSNEPEVWIFNIMWGINHGAGSLIRNDWVWVYGFNLCSGPTELAANAVVAKAASFSLKSAMSSRV